MYFSFVCYIFGIVLMEFRDFVSFQISCSNSSYKNCSFEEWHSASASLDTSSSVMILIPTICSYHYICGVRYAWSPVPCHLKNCSVYGKENLLPGPPFIIKFETNKIFKEIGIWLFSLSKMLCSLVVFKYEPFLKVNRWSKFFSAI